MGGLFILLFEAPVRYIESSFYQLLLTGYIVYQELQYFEICLDTAIGMTEILDTLLGYNSDTDIDLGGHEKDFIMSLVTAIMRACICLLFLLYLRNLLFMQLLMKMLLTIFLKVLHHVVEVMFALMVVLLVLIVVHSGVHHT